MAAGGSRKPQRRMTRNSCRTSSRRRSPQGPKDSKGRRGACEASEGRPGMASLLACCGAAASRPDHRLRRRRDLHHHPPPLTPYAPNPWRANGSNRVQVAMAGFARVWAMARRSSGHSACWWPWVALVGRAPRPAGPLIGFSTSRLAGWGMERVSANLWRTGGLGREEKKLGSQDGMTALEESRLLQLCTVHTSVAHLSEPAEASPLPPLICPSCQVHACPNQHSSSTQDLATAPAGPSAAGAQWVPHTLEPGSDEGLDLGIWGGSRPCRWLGMLLGVGDGDGEDGDGTHFCCCCRRRRRRPCARETKEARFERPWCRSGVCDTSMWCLWRVCGVCGAYCSA